MNDPKAPTKDNWFWRIRGRFLELLFLWNRVGQMLGKGDKKDDAKSKCWTDSLWSDVNGLAEDAGRRGRINRIVSRVEDGGWRIEQVEVKANFTPWLLGFLTGISGWGCFLSVRKRRKEDDCVDDHEGEWMERARERGEGLCLLKKSAASAMQLRVSQLVI